MKPLRLFSTLALLCAFVSGCNNNTKPATPGLDLAVLPPYSIQLVEHINPALPDLHSFTHAISGDTIVLFGGRTSGLHMFTYTFRRTLSNDSMYVIATNGWSSPENWTVYSRIYNPALLPGVYTKQIRANNAQFFTKNNVLYVIGGLLGAKGDSGNITTLPYMTAFSLSPLIQQIVKGTPMPPNSIRQVMSNTFSVTGGEVGIIGDTVHLAFGWIFPQPGNSEDSAYTHRISSFTFTDDGKTLSVTELPVCSTCYDWNKNPIGNDSGYYRRRDGSMSEMIDPATGQPSLLYYAGVFQNGNTSFSSPVWIYQNTAAEDTSLTMRSNVYTCQVVPVWSKLRQQSYATMLGGMTNSTFTGSITSTPVFLSGANAPINPIDVNAFTHVPFTNQISTILIDAKHQYYQFLMPDTFPATQVSYTLPAQTDTPVYKSAIMPAGSLPYNGAEAELIWTLNVKYLVNGVIDYDKFSSDNAGGGTIGYLHGGILSFKNNILAYPNPNGNGSSYHYSIASNRIFEIRLVPNK